MRLRGKIFIEGKIEALTGLAIGGSKSDTVIGGIDNSVIKTSEGIPFIPGSSLKGKMRSLLELSEGKELCTCGKCDICAIFGVGANKRPEDLGPTRIMVRDAHLNRESEEQMRNKQGIFKDLELIYTEGKWENVIDRKTSKAQHPRQMERVPAGAKFDFSIVFDIFESKDIDRFYKLLSAMAMVEDDYIGGSGSRGYGRIKFVDFMVSLKSIKDYQGDNRANVLGEALYDLATLMGNEELEGKLSRHLGDE